MEQSQPTKILVVDDNPVSLVSAKAVLTGSGYDLVTVQSGEAALRSLLTQDFALVLLDVHMPDMDGFETARRIRGREASRSMPIIYLSAQRMTEEMAATAYGLGAIDYLVKPLAPDILRAKVNAAVQRHEATRELQRSEANLRNLMESSIDGMVVVAGDGRIAFVNRVAAALFRKSEEELRGTLFGSPVVAGEATELDLVGSQGKSLCVEMRVSDTEWQGARAALVSLRDITERKAIAEQLRLGSEELRRLNRNLRDRNSEIRTFYHTLSHELKTPLTAAREFIAIVLDGLAGPLNEAQAEHLEIAKESCDQLRLYVNDLLDVTRLETGKMAIQPESLPVAALVERVVETLGPAAVAKGVGLSHDCQAGGPAIPIDRLRILQVLSNLTTNAIKFTPAGGTILLSAGDAPGDPEAVQVSVRDSGVGIPSEQLGDIFNRLHQVGAGDATGGGAGGLGLGLYITQELVALHGGRLWAESVPGSGSTFTFTLPKRRVAGRASVLVVDDDIGLGSAVCDLLEDAGYRVRVAIGGREALDHLRQELPALVILDLKMAGVDGPAVMKEIRSRPGTPIPVIVHTGYPASDLMERVLEFSPFTVVAKPAPPGVLLESVGLLLREAGQAPGRGDRA